MNWVDLLIIVILAASTLIGFRQGLILELAVIVGVIVAMVVAKAEWHTVQDLLVKVLPHSPWLTTISYLIVLLVVWALIILLAQRIRFFARLLLLGMMDRLGGALIGLLEGVIVVGVLLYFGRRVHNHALHQAVAHARLEPLFGQVLPFVDKLLPHIHY